MILGVNLNSDRLSEPVLGHFGRSFLIPSFRSIRRSRSSSKLSAVISRWYLRTGSFADELLLVEILNLRRNFKYESRNVEYLPRMQGTRFLVNAKHSTNCYATRCEDQWKINIGIYRSFPTKIYVSINISCSFVTLHIPKLFQSIPIFENHVGYAHLALSKIPRKQTNDRLRRIFIGSD